jgi:hypothetical protein
MPSIAILTGTHGTGHRLDSGPGLRRRLPVGE